MYPDGFLQSKLDERLAAAALRSLTLPPARIDFCSNDYLGFARLEQEGSWTGGALGSTGSRLLSGNHPIHLTAEDELAHFHQVPAALLFNSGYDANLGLFSAVATTGDTILYDMLSHASIRDGIRLSKAQAFAFPHNDLEGLAQRLRNSKGRVFVATEAVFSMDGDLPPLQEMVDLCEKFGAHLVVDEAHALGVMGPGGAGLVQDLGLQERIFARVVTFGKAAGAHGAAVLGSTRLKSYLVNFARSLVYSTALSPHSVAAIRRAYALFPGADAARSLLAQHIAFFQSSAVSFEKINSSTPIQGIKLPGNACTRNLALRLQAQDFDVRPILYPTVPKGEERIRIILHAFNTPAEVSQLVAALSQA